MANTHIIAQICHMIQISCWNFFIWTISHVFKQENVTKGMYQQLLLATFPTFSLHITIVELQISLFQSPISPQLTIFPRIVHQNYFIWVFRVKSSDYLLLCHQICQMCVDKQWQKRAVKDGIPIATPLVLPVGSLQFRHQVSPQSKHLAGDSTRGDTILLFWLCYVIV